ncbi:hypothetical protein AB0I68_10940 [Streptomyces sp. NPDC050448]|uniref:hypothetical protein n=1 Tax=Streptomyces sp. NPDC050448 TaxID=3155404 RepID=UPI003427FB43
MSSVGGRGAGSAELRDEGEQSEGGGLVELGAGAEFEQSAGGAPLAEGSRVRERGAAADGCAGRDG